MCFGYVAIFICHLWSFERFISSSFVTYLNLFFLCFYFLNSFDYPISCFFVYFFVPSHFCIIKSEKMLFSRLMPSFFQSNQFILCFLHLYTNFVNWASAIYYSYCVIFPRHWCFVYCLIRFFFLSFSKIIWTSTNYFLSNMTLLSLVLPLF